MKKFTALVLSLLMCAAPISASEAADDTSAMTQAVEENENKKSDGMIIGGLLMVGAIVSASWISTMIFRGRDKTKYL